VNLTLRVWRQKNASAPGALVAYPATDISPDSSFLEMLDQVNETLLAKGEEPIAFDHDCREGICGMCSLVIDGVPHGPERGTTVCQLHMRHFRDGQTVVIEPFRARAFPVLRDLVVNRGAFDRIIQAGGFVSVNTGGAPMRTFLRPKVEATGSMRRPASAAGLRRGASQRVGCCSSARRSPTRTLANRARAACWLVEAMTKPAGPLEPL
jgi:succinate dehydrogenase / fumarate reductase iron-sulfur subunit